MLFRFSVFFLSTIYIISIISILIDKSFLNYKNHIIPFFIIINLLFLIMNDENKDKIKSKLIYFTFIFMVSYFIEVIGVNYKVIFGSYEYGNSLGIKIFSTPILIGINWFFLIYLTASIYPKSINMKIPKNIKILISSLLMLAYDIVLEPVSSKLDLWYWSNNTIPIQNYIAWFVLSLLFHYIINKNNQILTNKLSAIIYIYQIIFFLIINMVY